MRNLIDLIEAHNRPGATLFHGTLVDNLQEIQVHGLRPGIGEFTRSAYDIADQIDEDDDYAISIDDIPELVFAADRQGINRCHSAIIGALRARYRDVNPYTAEAMKDHGALLIMRGEAERFEHRSHDDHGDEDHPMTVEPGDFYSDQYIPVTGVLIGKRLVQFLVRNGVTFQNTSDLSLRVMVGRVVAQMIRQGMNRTDALAKVRAMGPHEIMRQAQSGA